jgi:hypothetical protein
MPSLDELIVVAGAHARQVLVRQPGAQLLPTWLIHAANNDLIIIATPWADDRQKAITAEAMRATMRERKALAYSFLCEAWMAHKSLPDGVSPQEAIDRTYPMAEMPRNDPNRIETVVATAGNRDGSKSAMWRMVRDTAGVVVELVPEEAGYEMSVGRFDDILTEAQR